MLWIIIVTLAALWMLGMILSVTLGGALHLLLVVAAVLLGLQIVTQGRTMR